MGRDRSRSRSMERNRDRDRDRRRRSRSRSRDRDRRRRSRSRDRSDRGRDRDRDGRKGRDRSRDRDRTRRRDRSRERRRSRSKDREPARELREDKKPKEDDAAAAPAAAVPAAAAVPSAASPPAAAAPSTEQKALDPEEEKKRKRMELLAKFKQAKEQKAQQEVSKAPEEKPPEEKEPSREAAWMPWEDPGALLSSASAADKPPPPMRPRKEELAPEEDDGIDPLDAFMATEVMPEVKAKEEERKKAIQEERIAKAKLLAEGKKIPKLVDLEDSDEEEEIPDVEIEVPANKVKLIIGPGGTKIGEIQKKSKARVQVKKSDEELNRGWGQGVAAPPKGPQPPLKEGEKKMVTIMIYGSQTEVETAQRMIEEAMDNKEQKQKQRQKEYDKKRETKRINREMYYLRHALDYDALGVPIGTSKADVRKAYRKLAVKWHPDKHQMASEEKRKEAEKKFQEIQRAFDCLMATDEEATIEALKAAR